MCLSHNENYIHVSHYCTKDGGLDPISSLFFHSLSVPALLSTFHCGENILCALAVYDSSYLVSLAGALLAIRIKVENRPVSYLSILQKGN